MSDIQCLPLAWRKSVREKECVNEFIIEVGVGGGKGCTPLHGALLYKGIKARVCPSGKLLSS